MCTTKAAKIETARLEVELGVEAQRDMIEDERQVLGESVRVSAER